MIRSGQQHKQLQLALIDAFPTPASLERMLAYELDQNLRAIAGEGNLQDIVFKLIEAAESQGWVKNLVIAASKSNPGNELLKAITEELLPNKHEELINILQPFFNQERNEILIAYESSLPNRLIDKKVPENEREIISGLLLFQSYVEKFVGYLLLNKQLSPQLKQELQRWAKENIEGCTQFIEKLAQEQRQREQECPCLMIAISKPGDNYVVEAWFIENLAQYHRESSSGCKKLQIDNQGEIPTDKKLENLPRLVRDLIDKSSVKIEQIHIFLPLELMNHAVDSWTTSEDDEETIGETYKVFIRCSEGLRGKNPRLLAWQKKGQSLKDKLAQPAADIFTLGDSKQIKTLEKQLKQENAIGVKIIPVFQDNLPGEILWKASVPLALWVRQELPDIDNIEILDKLINNCNLEELPEKIRQKRLDAMDNKPPENHVGRHLCLLWDDPNLLPPEQLLTENIL